MRLYRELLTLAVLSFASVTFASKVSIYDVESAARGFAAEGHHLSARIGLVPSDVREHTATDGSEFFSIRFAGGGTVFMSGDDDREPVIAYTSADIDYDSLDRSSPLYVLLNCDANARRGLSSAKQKWNRLLVKGDAVPVYSSLLSMTPLSLSSLTTPGDVRVPALIETQWGQDKDKTSNRCFNRDTPNHYVCGCIATAMSQIMRYHCWPDSAHPVTAKTYQCYIDGSGSVMTTQGGTYDWNLMPTDTAGDYISSDEQRQAIAKLTSDAGISVRMDYTSGGSASFGLLAANAFMDTWNYGQSTFLNDTDGRIDAYVSAAEHQRVLSKALLSNIDAGYPVMLGIGGEYQGQTIGHSIVADGYGYDGGTDYVHLNMGWSGQGDVWYNLPTISLMGQDFYTVPEVVYNIFPTNGVSCATLSGRIIDGGSIGIPSAAVTVYKSGTEQIAAQLVSSSSGVYGTVLPSGNYDVVAVSSDGTLTGTVTNVNLPLPAASSEYYGLYFTSAPEYVKCNRNVMSANEIGNSWGNDIVLDNGLRQNPTNFYVSAKIGVDAPDRGTSDAPYATIQYAITNGQRLVAGDVIHVRPGTYYGCVETPATSISIVSTDGPEFTSIDGEGLDCCYYGNANQQNLLSGFTVTNGAYYGGIFVGTATNCLIVNCVSSAQDAGSGGGACGAYLYDCVLHNNDAYYGGGAAYSTLVNCTVYDNWACYSGGGVDYNCAVTNSIVWRNWATDDDAEDNWEQYQDWYGGVYLPSFAYSCTYPDGFTDLGGNITNDPMCVSFNVDDWRLRVGSPCIGTALGGLNMGAWQGEPVEGYVINAEVFGRGTVSPWSQFVLPGESATFVAEGDHPFLAFKTNGVFVTDAREFVWTDVQSDGTLSAFFGVTNYYLDAVSGDDANDGLSWEAPLKSIYAMTRKAGSGDSVKVKPGVYDGCSWCVYGVEVESTEGAEATIIDGGGTNRCVYAPEMLYRGFTFRNGAMSTGYGGGAYYGTFVDCVFSNCTAAFGGAAAGSSLTNCLVVGNSAVRYRSGWSWKGGQGGGVYECDLVNCTLSANTAYSLGGGAYLHTMGQARNSIVCGNTCTSGSANGNDVYGNNYWTMSNSLSDVDAKFRDPANGDYRLTPSSPALDAGSMDFVSVDHDLAGTNRVWGRSVDIGCYEYHLPAGITDPTVIGVAAALTAEGYRGDYAAAVTEPKDYAYLVEWTASHALTAADLNASSTGFVSPGLNADGLINLDPTNIVLQSFVPSTNGVWSLALSLPDYDRSRINIPLLKSAIGVVGSESLTNGYSSADLSLVVTPSATNILVTVEPPSNATNYYMKATVR